jgi:hypothetical protein
MVALAEEAQHERARTKNRAIDAARLPQPQHRIVAPQTEQVAMQLINAGMRLALRKVELAPLERIRIVGAREGVLHLPRRQAAELLQKLLRPS